MTKKTGSSEQGTRFQWPTICWTLGQMLDKVGDLIVSIPVKIPCEEYPPLKWQKTWHREFK